MKVWIRNLARVLGIVVILLGFGIVRAYYQQPDFVPAWFVFLSLACLLAIFICLVGIILSDLPTKTVKHFKKK